MGTHIKVDNTFVIMISAIGAMGLCAMLLVIAVILAYSRDKHFQRERIMLGLSISSGLFSFMNIIPIGYNKFGLLNPTGYICVRGVWFFSKYMMAAYEIFVLIATIHGIRSRAVICRRNELVLHVVCLVLGLTALVTWLARAFYILKVDDHDPDQFYLDIADHFALYCEMWLGLVLFALLLWIYVQTKLCSVRSSWLRNNITIEMIDEDPDKQLGKFRLDKELEDAQRLVGPLQAYVLLFLLFAIPAGFLGIKCSHFDDCSLALEMVLSWRSLAFALVYFYEPDTRRLLHGYTIARLLTRRLTTTVRPDDIVPTREGAYMTLSGPTGGGGGDTKCAQQPYQLFTEELMLDQN